MALAHLGLLFLALALLAAAFVFDIRRRPIPMRLSAALVALVPLYLGSSPMSAVWLFALVAPLLVGGLAGILFFRKLLSRETALFLPCAAFWVRLFELPGCLALALIGSVAAAFLLRGKSEAEVPYGAVWAGAVALLLGRAMLPFLLG